MAEIKLKIEKKVFRCVINKGAAKTKYDQESKLLNIEIPLKVIGEVYVKVDATAND